MYIEWELKDDYGFADVGELGEVVDNCFGYHSCLKLEVTCTGSWQRVCDCWNLGGTDCDKDCTA